MAASLPSGTTAPRGLPDPELIRWPLVAARDLFELKYGKALVEPDRRPGSVPVYGTNGRCGSHDEALFKGPGVILGRKGQGPLGVEWSDDDYWVIDTAYALAPLRPDIDLRYAYFLIKFIGLNHLKDGTSNPTLSRDTFGAQALPLPPLGKQRAIAHILGTLDDKIELNRRMNETLEGIARAIFKSWFVDFGPVRAKAEGRNPGLPKPIADIFPDSFEDSELGEIPLGWEVKRAGDAVRAVGGGTPSTQEQKYWDGGDYHWVTPKDLSGLIAPILLDTERKITKAGLSQISSGLLPAGTVLMSSRAPVGYLALAAMPVAINQGFIGMVCDGSVSNYYTINWCHYNMDEIKQRASGTTFAEISKAAFRPIPMLIPRKTVMHAFTNKVAPLYDAIKIKLEESRTLAALRDALLPKLISGELRVRAAERIVGRIL